MGGTCVRRSPRLRPSAAKDQRKDGHHLLLRGTSRRRRRLAQNPVYKTTYYASTPERLLPIPKEWIIAPLDTRAAQCPPLSETLLTFGITNLVVALLAVFFGCRPLVHKLTRGLLGRTGGTSIRWVWIITLAAQLLGNLLIAHLISTTPGYGHLPLFNVFALFSARPRVGLVASAFLRILVKARLQRFGLREKGPAGEQSEYVYVDAYTTNALAELSMQIFGAAFVGVTWSRFRNEGARRFMSPSYKFVEATPAITFVATWLFFPIMKHWAFIRAGPMFSESYHRGKYYHVYMRVVFVILAAVFIGLGYMAQWAYFVQFLKLPGAL